MNHYIGIDLGTSGVKLLLVGSDGKIISEANESCDVNYPQDGWSEQDPQDWWINVNKALKSLLENQDKSLIKGISFGGQMHGLVILDQEDNVIRPCILWNDGRTQKQTAYLNEGIGKVKLSSLTANIAFAGFTAPKILWLKENEPENFNRIKKIMLPKDYIAYQLSGIHSTDYSDASGTLLLDVKNKCWSKEMCDICDITEEQLPKLFESYEVVGNILPRIADEFGLEKTVKIIAGAGDNAASAIGTGTVGNNACNISLGTSGTVFISSDRFSVDTNNALHSFCHANGNYHLMGCILSATSCNKWWLEDILGSNDYEKYNEEVKIAKDSNVLFLPYLMGERSPHNDVNARGSFIGLSINTTRGEMNRAVMEGVAFALKDCVETANRNGLNISSATLCGGGSKSDAWCQIISDILEFPIIILETEQGSSYGGAILAMVGCGEYDSMQDATKILIKIKETIMPTRNNKEYHRKKYQTFKKLYPLLKEIY